MSSDIGRPTVVCFVLQLLTSFIFFRYLWKLLVNFSRKNTKSATIKPKIINRDKIRLIRISAVFLVQLDLFFPEKKSARKSITAWCVCTVQREVINLRQLCWEKGASEDQIAACKPVRRRTYYVTVVLPRCDTVIFRRLREWEIFRINIRQLSP